MRMLAAIFFIAFATVVLIVSLINTAIFSLPGAVILILLCLFAASTFRKHS